MGGKITIDSATLMNKGLEVMEAHHLFGTPYERIDVVVHPQSLVHGLVQLADGAMLAHLGPPDMRIAISYALHGGESVELPIAPLDLAAVGELTLRGGRPRRLPVPAPGRRGRARGRHGAVCAERRQRDRRPRLPRGAAALLEIPPVIEQTLEELGSEPVRAFESLYESDRQARGRRRRGRRRAGLEHAGASR